MIAAHEFTTSADGIEAARYAMTEIRVGDLKIDSRYQRDVRKTHVRNLIANFDWYLLDPLVVARRPDGSLYVMDGQHRLLALRELGYEDQPVTCMVFEGLTLEQESRRFNTQDTRKQLTALERFKARLLEGRSAEMAVSEVLRSTGFTIDFGRHGSSRAGFSISCVGALLQVYRVGGAGHLRRVMTVIASGFGSSVKPDSMMVNGISAFLRRYEGECDETRLIDVIRRVPQEQVARDARGIASAVGTSTRVGYAMALAKQYNRNLQSRRLADFAAKAGGR